MAIQDKDAMRGEELRRELGFRGRLRYLWDYQKLLLLIVAAVILVVAYFVYKLTHPDPETLASVCLVEAVTPLDDTGNAFSQYLADYGYDAAQEEITVEIIDSTGYEEQVLSVRLMSGDIDVVVLSEELADTLVEGGGLMALEELFSAEFLEEYADSLYYGQDATTGEAHVYAIRLGDDNALIQAGYYEEAQLMGIAYSAERIEVGVSVMTYLLETP